MAKAQGESQRPELEPKSGKSDNQDKREHEMSELVFSTFGKVSVNDGSQVTIPDDRRADFQAAAAYFSQHTNRVTMTVPFAEIYPGDTAKAESEAKLFARQAKQWAESHDLSCSPKRDGASVTFRFARKHTPNLNGPVITSHVGDNAQS